MNLKRIDVIYDGDCPICRQFVLKRNIEQNNFTLNLINARTLTPAKIFEYSQQGYDLNNGMLVLYEGKHYYGHKAMRQLLKLSKHKNKLQSIFEWFYSKVNSPKFYQILVKMRLLLLLLLRKKKI